MAKGKKTGGRKTLPDLQTIEHIGEPEERTDCVTIQFVRPGGEIKELSGHDR